jgi:hypothetical protein
VGTMPEDKDKDIDTNHSPVEMSQEELDGISGGISIFVSGSTFQRSDLFAQSRRRSRRGGSGVSSFGSSQISSSAFQILGVGLKSSEDITAFFRGIFGFFGRR